MLLAEGLRHAFGAVRALDDVSFTLQPGQTLAVFGPNGAGKTTLLKVLAGLIRPRVGRAWIEGGRRAVGWIGHQAQLYAQLTVRENLRFWASLYDVPDADLRRREADLLARLGLNEHADRPVRALSRGLVQRVAIARALIHDPRALLLDEPFTGLDRTAAEQFRRLLAEQAAGGGGGGGGTSRFSSRTTSRKELSWRPTSRSCGPAGSYSSRPARDAMPPRSPTPTAGR